MLYDVIIAPFVEFAFMRRALIGGAALSIAAAPIGVFLMLRRMSLTGDAMAHAILPGAAIGYLVSGLSVGAMTIGGLVAGFVVAGAAGLVTRSTNLKEDASLAAFYLMSLSLGIAIVSLRGSNVDLLHVLFGSVLALDDATLLFLAFSATITLLALAVIYRPLVLECVDPGYLASVSGAGSQVHMIFMALVVIDLMAGFHAMGTLLAVGLMMLPAAIARLWTSDITTMMVVAVTSALIGTAFGLVGSYALEIPAGPAIMLVLGICYLISIALGTSGGVLWGTLPRRHFEA